jgi:hypothetical protein
MLADFMSQQTGAGTLEKEVFGMSLVGKGFLPIHLTYK